MVEKEDNDDGASGDVIPPEASSGSTDLGSESAILALISNYTDRPDLLIAEVEKHDPGFIKRMNQSAEAHAERLREGKYHFGKYQAYATLGIQILAAFVVLGLFTLAIWKSAGFWTIIALVIAYSVTQSGVAGFTKIANACSRALDRVRRDGSE